MSKESQNSTRPLTSSRPFATALPGVSILVTRGLDYVKLVGIHVRLVGSGARAQTWVVRKDALLGTASHAGESLSLG